MKSVNQEVAEGIVRILRRRMDSSQPSLTKLSDLLLVGVGEGVSPQAQTYIVEFLKDGVIGMKQEHVDAILLGDYTMLWRVVNKYLKHFGHLPIEPVPLTP